METSGIRHAGWSALPLALVAVMALGGATSVAAQAAWVDPDRNPGVWLEVLRPQFEGRFIPGEDVSFISSSVFLGGRASLTSELNLVGELPFAYGDLEGADLDGHRATVGNPYLGVEYLPGGPLAFEAGIRAPLADEESFGTLVGLATEFPSRTEAFLTDYWSVGAAASYDVPLANRLSLRLRGGGSLWLDTGDAVDPESDEVIELEDEFVASYGGQLWYRAPHYSLGAGLMGRAALTEDTGFDDQTVHEIAAAGNVALGRFVPGLQLRLPLDRDNDVDFVAGVHLAVRMR